MSQDDQLEGGTHRERRNQKVRDASPTGRSARFYAPLNDEMDVEAIAQRVAQHCAIALQRGEADFIQVMVQEAEIDD